MVQIFNHIKQFNQIYSEKERSSFLEYLNALMAQRFISFKELQPSEIPTYKNYSLMVENLLKNTKEWGAPLQGPLSDLKKMIEADFHFDRKVNKILLEGLFQSVVISFFIWVFVLAMKYTMGFKTSLVLILFLLCMQISGIFVTSFILIFGKKICFRGFDLLNSELLHFKGLLLAGFPLGQLAQKIDWQSLELLKNPLLPLVKRFNHSVTLTLQSGAGIKDEIDSCIKELHSVMENRLEFFQTQLKFYQFLGVVFFQLPCFMVTIYFLLSQSFQI